MNREARHHIVVIDMLRFACALGVVAYHFWMIFPLASSSATHLFGLTVPLPTDAAPFTASGWVGVEIFFVISGYVIALSAEHADRAMFARGRLLRLLPAALICGLVTTIVLAVSGALPPGEAMTRMAASITMLPFGPRIDGTWWTLQVETSFYIAVACLLRDDRQNRIRLERLGAFLTVWSLIYYIQAAARGEMADRAGTMETLVLMPHGMLFALGIALRSVAAHGWSMSRIAAGSAALCVALIDVIWVGRTYDGVAGVAQSAAIPAALFLTSVAAIALAPRVRVSGRSADVIRKVAALTYPLYLVHQTVGAATVTGLVAIGLPASASLVLGAFAMLALAYLITQIAEPPVRDMLSALMDYAGAPKQKRSGALAQN